MVLPWTLQMRSELELTKSQSQRSLVSLDVILIKPKNGVHPLTRTHRGAA